MKADIVKIVGTSGIVTVDFEERQIEISRQGILAKMAGLTNITIAFDDITDIELKQPSIDAYGMRGFIVKGIRYVTSHAVG